MPHGPKLEKPPQELVDRFSATVADLPGAQLRKMFGNPAAFVNGHLFTGLFGPTWFVRLPVDQRASLTAAGGTEFAPMPGRPMREYVVMPDVMAADASTAAGWARRALDHVAAKPPKPGR